MTIGVEPFSTAVADDVLDDLRSRLRNTRWPEGELVGDWSQGMPLQDPGDLPVLGGGIRLAPPQGAAQSLRAVHDRA
jgi:hypothetical protein